MGRGLLESSSLYVGGGGRFSWTVAGESLRITDFMMVTALLVNNI